MGIGNKIGDPFVGVIDDNFGVSVGRSEPPTLLHRGNVGEYGSS